MQADRLRAAYALLMANATSLPPYQGLNFRPCKAPPNLLCPRKGPAYDRLLWSWWVVG